jgi:hypothetical protein
MVNLGEDKFLYKIMNNTTITTNSLLSKIKEYFNENDLKTKNCQNESNRFTLSYIEASLLDETELSLIEKKCKDTLNIIKKVSDSESLCVVCVDNKKKVVFLPCKHCCTCDSCSKKLEVCILFFSKKRSFV